eukprot:TRINITY_DN5542_c0_g1_i2.p1 TRINITY_DN5542_c0_g1~~TRINITY_DN5542_c0_g1_i2.p1  ORF type:complete len:218 (-),score=69.36 TRINITY_DN5542_c0_g1_i2:5-658(-)
MAVLMKWLAAQSVKGMTHELFEEPGRTPFLLIEIEGTTPTEKTLFMYGHMDKQPPLLPWEDGLGPYTPVIRDDKLYGRAGADDGYAICGSVASVAALQRAGIPHGRIVITIEGCEESGSFDLPHYINMLKDRIGNVDLVVCLDAGALNYDQLWLTTCLLYTSDAADEEDSVDLGGRRIIKKKKKHKENMNVEKKNEIKYIKQQKKKQTRRDRKNKEN